MNPSINESMVSSRVHHEVMTWLVDEFGIKLVDQSPLEKSVELLMVVKKTIDSPINDPFVSWKMNVLVPVYVAYSPIVNIYCWFMTFIYNLLAVFRKYGSATNIPVVMSYDWKPSIGIVIVSHQPLQIKFKWQYPQLSISFLVKLFNFGS